MAANLQFLRLLVKFAEEVMFMLSWLVYVNLFVTWAKRGEHTRKIQNANEFDVIYISSTNTQL